MIECVECGEEICSRCGYEETEDGPVCESCESILKNATEVVKFFFSVRTLLDDLECRNEIDEARITKLRRRLERAVEENRLR